MGSFDDLKKLSSAQKKTSRKSLDAGDSFEEDELPHDEHALTLTGASGRRLKRELSTPTVSRVGRHAKSR